MNFLSKKITDVNQSRFIDFSVENDDNMEVLGERLDKVRTLLKHEREYGNDWCINYWTIVERQLSAKWEKLVREHEVKMLTHYTNVVFEMGTAQLVECQ
jgi:hypothetical protein